MYDVSVVVHYGIIAKLNAEKPRKLAKPVENPVQDVTAVFLSASSEDEAGEIDPAGLRILIHCQYPRLLYASRIPRRLRPERASTGG
jgi:hypothetical protein